MELIAIKRARINSTKTMIKNKDINLSFYSTGLGSIDEIKFLTKLSVLLIRRMSSLKSAIILSVVLFTISLVPKCVIICRSYKRFFNKALPVRSLYAIKDDGLHLNEVGQYELRRCFQHAINHM
jgi:hypothetical protein